uniref:Uncharacterized protein n=1 Tax=Arundo donax TaxID=35708 RepID=A0A0A9EQA8_ARUDO
MPVLYLSMGWIILLFMSSLK